jgi:hypothetical protein
MSRDPTDETSKLFSSMADNYRRHMNPILRKWTRQAIREGVKALKKAGSSNAEEEHEAWLKQTVDPKEASGYVDSDDDDGEGSPMPQMATDLDEDDDIEVVVSSDEEGYSESESTEGEDFIVEDSDEESNMEGDENGEEDEGIGEDSDISEEVS